MNTYEKFLLEKYEKSVTDVRKEKTKEGRFPMYLFFQLSKLPMWPTTT